MSLLEDIKRDPSMKVHQKELDLIGYRAVLDADQMKPTNFMVDFAKAAINSFKEHFLQ